MSHAIPMISTARSASGHPHLLARMAGAVAASMAGLAREVRLYRAVHQVEALDDRLLADIGIGHGQAEGVVRHGRDALAAEIAPARAPVRLDLGRGWTEWR